MSYVIETKNLTYAYSKGMPDEKVAVRDISLGIEKGEFVGIIGHTGSGKSTFIQHLNGLLRPTDGQVCIDGEDLWENKDKLQEYRFKVGLVFQYPEYQLFEETVFKDIAFGPRNLLRFQKGMAQKKKKKMTEAERAAEDSVEEAVRKRVYAAASYVGITDEMMERSPFDLSGGQRRRVAIAGVLAMEPEVLILDEPTAGLDPAGRTEILNEIKRYHEEKGNTILFVSHSMDDIAKYANKVLVINEGALWCYDDAQTVFTRASELNHMGLAIPTVTDILLQLRARGFAVQSDVYTVEDAANQLLEALGKGGGAHA